MSIHSLDQTHIACALGVSYPTVKKLMERGMPYYLDANKNVRFDQDECLLWRAADKQHVLTMRLRNAMKNLRGYGKKPFLFKPGDIVIFKDRYYFVEKVDPLNKENILLNEFVDGKPTLYKGVVAKQKDVKLYAHKFISRKKGGEA